MTSLSTARANLARSNHLELLADVGLTLATASVIIVVMIASTLLGANLSAENSAKFPFYILVHLHYLVIDAVAVFFAERSSTKECSRHPPPPIWKQLQII
jgi:hypothetical protein